jgi:hypothetical protein
LSGFYAYLLETVRQDYGRAEELYRKSIDLNPESRVLANLQTAYANFLEKIRKDNNKAEDCSLSPFVPGGVTAWRFGERDTSQTS